MFYFFSLHSLDKIYAVAAIYLHGEVMLDIYYNDLYKEIHFNCFTVLFWGKKTDDDEHLRIQLQLHIFLPQR